MTIEAAVPAPQRRPRSWRLAAGLAVLGFFVLSALLSIAWTPVDNPTRLRIAERLQPPSVDALLGTDQLGRDVASLIMLGAQNSLLIAAAAVLLGGLAGIAIGLLAASRRGVVGDLLMRLMDIVFAFPPILSAMMLAAALGAGAGNAALAIAIFMTPVFARVTRAGALRILSRDFVLAARGAGRSGPSIAVRHVLPNIAGELAVQASIQFGLAILTEAGLSFLGLGIAPPTPSWGRMLSDSQTFLTTAPWLALAPGIAIALTVLGANLLGDGLRDRFDPRGNHPS